MAEQLVARSRRATQTGREPQGDTPKKGVPETLRVRMLGGFSVSVGHRTIQEDQWRLRKAASLVKLLALEPGHKLHRERVMDLLWPDLDAKGQANNLRQALHAARRMLKPKTTPETASRYLERRGELLELCPGGVLWVDVEAFEEAAAAARRSREPGAYRAALDLYVGELLPADRYEEWAEERREGLRGTYLALLLELATLHEERGQAEEAIKTLGRVVEAEPVREEAHSRLMRLYALSGRSGEALGQYERLQEALSRELNAEPAAASRHLHKEILAGRISPSQPRASPPPDEPPGIEKHNLPAPRSSFVGRERELVEVKRTLAMTRLLTLTGTGGAGKTRLALEVTKDLVGGYPDGVWLVELAGLSEPELLPQEVAEALNVREQPSRPLVETLVEALRAKEMLLVLDNCEHLVDAVAHLVDTLLDSCPRIRVLATSREALNIIGEVACVVPSLSVPGPQQLPKVEELENYEATRLFLEQARYRNPAFVLAPQEVTAVAQICRRLEGIPLAIELAVARLRTLSVVQIAERLKEPLKLLTAAGSRMVDPRHQTLRATLEWSYDLLVELERKLLERLSVFTDGWSLEAAEAVGTGGTVQKDDVLDLLSRLVDKSLVVVGATPGEEGVARYRMLEPVRQYVREQLEESGEAQQARKQHAEYYLALAEEAEPKLVGAEQTRWLERLETEHDNLRAALRWLLEKREAERALRLVGALGEFWRIRGHLREGQGWLEAALAIEGGDTLPERLKALNYAGWIAWNCLDFERTTAASQELLTLSRELGDDANVAAALHHLGMVAIYDQMKAEKARALFEESLRIRRELGDEVGASYSLQRLGLISVVQRDFGRARALYEECLALSRKTDAKMSALNTLWLGGLAYLGLGDHEKVEQVCKEGIGLARRIGNWRLAALILYVLAASIGRRGRPVRACRLWGAAESFMDSLGLSLGPAERYHYGPYIASAREQLDETAWEVAWAEGQAMSLEQAIEYAFLEEEEKEEKDTPPSVFAPEGPPADEPTDKLTRREREVATLIAGRLTNRQAAKELSISERTVENHVANILNKLNFSSRSQVADWVEERPLREADPS